MTLRVAPNAFDRSLRYDDEVVVFNPLSWDTHILNAAAASVFEYIAEAPRSQRDIESFLAELLVDSERADCVQHAGRLVRELLQLGLIEELREERQAAHAAR